jgi:hypothetical protein
MTPRSLRSLGMTLDVISHFRILVHPYAKVENASEGAFGPMSG